MRTKTNKKLKRMKNQNKTDSRNINKLNQKNIRNIYKSEQNKGRQVKVHFCFVRKNTNKNITESCKQIKIFLDKNC